MELANSGLIWSGSLVLGLIYWYVTKKQNFWSQLGVPGPKPTFLIGNLDRFRKSVSEFEIGCTRKYGPVYGLYLGLKPVLTITDPELVKRVLVRDFNHFVDRLVINTSHSIMTQHLLLLQGDRWKRTRAIVTPTFTSGKLRGMQQLMNRAVDKLSDYFDKLLNDAGQGKFTTKEVISGFTIDVIASTTFATETNANDDRSNRNPFVINGIKMFDVNPLKILFVQALPKWFNINVLGVEYFPPKEPAEFFMNLTRTIVQQRKSASTSASASTSKKHTDLVQLLVDASIDESELNTTNWNKLTAEVEPNENATTYLTLDNQTQTMENSSIFANAGLVCSAILAIVAVLIYRYVSWRQNYWQRLGIPGPKPTFLVGNLERFQEALSKYEIDWTKHYGSVYGFYLGLKPVLTVSDPELIKRVMVRDFNQFVNRQEINTFHKIMTENLFLLEGERWKRVRTISTPSFTSGKLRGMKHLMNRAVDKLIVYFDKLTDANSTGRFITKEVIAGFTIDVIATTTFATETNTNDDRSKKSPFIENGLKIFDVNPLKAVAIIALPKWFNINVLGIEYLPPKGPANFFMNLTEAIVKQRRSAPAGAQKRNDLVQSLLEASVDDSKLKNIKWDQLSAGIDQELDNESTNLTKSNSNVQKLTENEVIAQCIVFFLAGFETTAATISHCLFELAKNQDVQQRLCDELNKAFGDGPVDTSSDEYYDKVISHVPYLEAVIKETLRKYAPVVRLNRRLNSDRYQMTDSLEIRKNQTVEIPIYSVHYNPEFYPEPTRFNPERFLPENRDKLVPYTWVPFGTGPRNCVGMRFALQEIKMLLAQIIRRYRFAPSVNTPDQLKFRNGAVLLLALPFELEISRRQ